jgi:hypothetical protein
MATIQKSVGKKGKNISEDVMVIQLLLNKFIVPGCMLPFKPLGVDGDCGKMTKAAIVWFQLNVMGNPFPDGRVDPGGNTLNALNGPLKWPTGPPKTPPKPEPDPEPPPVSKYDPRRIDPTKFDKVLRKPDSVHTSWAFYPTVSPGQVYSLYSGNRIVLTARQDGIIFILDKKDHTAGVYLQEVKGFVNDVAVDAFIRVGERSAIFQTIARAEVIFLTGLVCGASGWALLGSLSLSAVEFVAEHKNEIPKWVAAIDQLLESRKVLKKYTPTLWQVIEDQIFKTTLSALKEGTIYDHDYIAQSIGVTVGIVGAKAFTRDLRWWKIALSVLGFICGRAFSAAISATKYLPAQIEADATKLFNDLQANGFQVSKATVLKIAQEVAANPAPIKQTLADLKTATEACF